MEGLEDLSSQYSAIEGKTQEGVSIGRGKDDEIQRAEGLVGLPIKHLAPTMPPPKELQSYYDWKKVYPYLSVYMDNIDVLKREMLGVR